MANVLVEEQYLSDIASAIRNGNGLSSTYTPSQMASKIGLDWGLVTKAISGTIYNDKISHVGSYAFFECRSLKGINFPSCKSIYMAAFSGCENLEIISLPECVSIGNSVFYGCSRSLTTINLPKCTYIGSMGFC